MRQIGFRGKSIAEEWHYGLLAQSAGLLGQVDEGMYISNTVGAPYAYQVIPTTIGERLGRQDKNNIEIYEGDILTDDYDRRLLVEWWGHGFCFKALIDTNFIRAREITQWFEGDCARPEIIGNIHDNPDPLEAHQ